jgi:ribonuclease BN (tRNA processing enzyme)
MRIEFLGSGSAFVLAEENYQSNILLSKIVDGEQKRLLFDAGTTIAESLNAAGYEPKDIDSIFISHLHADHAGGVEYLGFKNFFSTFPFGQIKPKLISHKSVLESGWDNTWKGGMKSIEGKMTTLETFFDTVYLEDNGVYDFYGTEIKIIQTVHIVDDRKIVPSYGIMFNNYLGETIFITGDSQMNPNQLRKYYDEADIIFHDCELADYDNSVHAQYNKLKTLPGDIKDKMWLYHYTTQNGTIELPEAVVDGFMGFVKRGDEF